MSKALERRYNLEIEEAKIESISNKKKLEECLEQLETVKRKAGLSKEDGKLEGKAEADAARAMVKDLEEQLRTQGAEYRKHRDDHGAMASRLASALQTAQVAMAECEAAKAQAAGAMSEGQTSHSALIQATHRIQHLDSECAQMKADLLLSRSMGETQDGDTRKLQTICSINEEKLALTTSDLKRLKATTQVNTVLYCTLLYCSHRIVMSIYPSSPQQISRWMLIQCGLMRFEAHLLCLSKSSLQILLLFPLSFLISSMCQF